MTTDELRGLPPPLPTALADLTWLNIGDMCAAFGLPPNPPLRGLAELLAFGPARHFATQLLSFDTQVGRSGLSRGGAWMCQHYSAGVHISGPAVPATGPLVIAANHPGILDAAALCSAIERRDLRVLAIKRPLLRALPQISAHLFAVEEHPAARTVALRTAARHLRNGGALLTFPAGRIEPDPLLDPRGAQASLTTWSDSLDLLIRLSGPVTVQTALVSGVIDPATLRHPLTRLRRTSQQRQYLAAILQLIQPERHRVTVRVARSAPWLAEPTAGRERTASSQAVRRAIHQLIDEVA